MDVTRLGTALSDRRYVSQFAIDKVGLKIHRSGVLADADPGTDVLVRMVPIDFIGNGGFTNRPATWVSAGAYESTLSSVETSVPGLYEVTWTYSIAAAAQTYAGMVEVGVASPAYDALSIGFQAIIESAYIRFADLFDSPDGGPHLSVYFQTRFGRERMAQLLQVAVYRLNTIAQPHASYTLDPQGAFPFAQWGGLLDQGLYIEAVKHLIRSYVEQPEAAGVVVARMDRRDYMSRWQAVLEWESKDFASQLETFKIANMGLGRGRVLISGGVFGNYGPTRFPGLAAQSRSWGRYY